MRLLFQAVGAVLLFGILVTAALQLLLALAFWAPDRAERGSLAYLLAIPSAAKEFPIWHPCGSASYSYRFQDGLSPETYWIDYRTRLSLAELRRQFNAHASSKHCDRQGKSEAETRRANADAIMACRAGTRTIHITTGAYSSEKEPGCRRVTILFVEDL